MNEWKPIDGAPRDGSKILLTAGYGQHRGGWITIGHYTHLLRGQGFDWHSLDGDHVCYPTHWMPLPEPPK